MAKSIFSDPEIIDQWLADNADLLAVVPDVAIVKAGYQYSLSSGDYTATLDDVADFVASQDDPVVHAPRVWIGHPDDSGRFPRPKSGEPALGVFQNIRLNENGTQALGDLVALKWLAALAPVTWPNRSMEGYTEHTTHTGKTWSLVIPDVALLGVSWPGIHCLDDLPIVLSAEGPEGVEVTDTTSKEVAVSQITAGTQLVAQVNVEDIDREAWAQWPERDEFYWIIAHLCDPQEVVCEDSKGQLYKVPVTISGDDITFGDSTPVKVVYEEKAQVTTEASAAARRTAAIAAVADGRTPVAVYASREQSRPNTTKEASVSDSILDKLKGKLRLASDATEDEVLDAVPEPEPETDPANEPATDPPAGDGEQEPSGEGDEPDAEAANDTVVLDRQTFEKLKAGADAGTELKAQSDTSRRAAKVEAAIEAGKIPPARREHYATLMAADEAGTTELLEKLEAGVVPVDERGSAEQTAASSGGDLNALFPQLNSKDGE